MESADPANMPIIAATNRKPTPCTHSVVMSGAPHPVKIGMPRYMQDTMPIAKRYRWLVPMRLIAKGRSASGPSTHSKTSLPSAVGASLPRVVMMPPSGKARVRGPSMNPQRKILVPTWQSGAPVTATTK
jgi:hypothetical protein